MVLTPRQPDLGPSPMVLAPPRVSKAASQFQRGFCIPRPWGSPRYRIVASRWILLLYQWIPPWWPTSGVSSGCGVSLLFFPFLGFRGLGSFLGFGVFGFGFGFGVPGFAFLGFFPGGSPMDSPSPPSGPGAERFFRHGTRSSSLSGSSSCVVFSSGEIIRLPDYHPASPFEFNWFLIRVTFVVIREHGCLAVEAMLLSEVINKFVNHCICPLSTD